MERSRLTSIEKIVTPACSRCGSETRLFGIEAHTDRDIFTFVCSRCDEVEIENRVLAINGAA